MIDQILKYKPDDVQVKDFTDLYKEYLFAYIELVILQGACGLYNQDTKTIYVDECIENKLKSNYVLLHEICHALTINIENDSNDYKYIMEMEYLAFKKTEEICKNEGWEDLLDYHNKLLHIQASNNCRSYHSEAAFRILEERMLVNS